jgi:hypothetical protein
MLMLFPISGYLSSNNVGLNVGMNFDIKYPYIIPKIAIKIIHGFSGKYLERAINITKKKKNGVNSKKFVDPKFYIVSNKF